MSWYVVIAWRWLTNFQNVFFVSTKIIYDLTSVTLSLWRFIKTIFCIRERTLHKKLIECRPFFTSLSCDLFLILICVVAVHGGQAVQQAGWSHRELPEGRGTIDISWVDWAYKSSTCDVMCIVDTAPPFTYIMVVKFRNTICPPAPPQLSLHTRAAQSSNSNGTRSVCNRKNPKSSLYCVMSMKGTLYSFL
jgi:hypothetical protein